MTVVLVVLAVVGYTTAALLSAGEVAVGLATKAQVSALVASGHRSAGRVAALVGRPAQVQGAAGFARLISEMTATVAMSIAVAESTDWPWWGVLATCIVLSTVVALALVRVSPRGLGRRHPVGTLSALSRLLVAVTLLAGNLGRDRRTDRESEEDRLRDMVAESEAIEEPERQMVRSVLELGDHLTREVMVPRTDMVTVRADAPVSTALTLLLRSGYSRVPVTGESVDDLHGVLYLKDVVRLLSPGPGPDEPDLEAVVGPLARPAFFVPESKPVDDLLRELRDGPAHLAMVVDEYGGIAGLVTIEDAVEEIVGELTDEHDRSGPVVEDLGDGRYRVPARYGRDELGELFDIEVDDEDVDTAGGLLAKALGKVPLPGSSGVIHGLHLEADRVEGRRRRLATVIVRRSRPSEGTSTS
jgi:CBS domain containing-hemolysin-like protein